MSLRVTARGATDAVISAGNTPQPGRAHLLPLIKSRTTNDSLAFFASYFRPLSERVFTRKVAADDGGRGAEAKVWETLVVQIWNCFPGFCETPRDLEMVSAVLRRTSRADARCRA